MRYRDAPNAWPPHQFIVLEALRQLPSNISSGSLPLPSGNQSTFDLIPSGQIGLSEDQLPGQAITGTVNNPKTGPGADLNKLDGTIVNGGNATSGEGWAQTLQRELANRYIASAFCSWQVNSIDRLIWFPHMYLGNLGMPLVVKFRESSRSSLPKN